MKKLAAFALLLNLGLFTLGCEKPKEKPAAPAEGAPAEGAPAEGAPAK
jgi:hypothetical protein